MTFEGLNAALSLITEEFGCLDAARRAADENPHSRLLQYRTTRARETLEAAKDAGYKIIADVMLPAIVGGTWRRADNANWLHGRDRTFYSRPIFDHIRAFRLAGTRGAGSWKNSIIVSQPYKGALTNGTETISGATIEQANAIKAAYGVHVWANHDLSPYYPGHASLLLVGTLLAGLYAERFGFVAL